MGADAVSIFQILSTVSDPDDNLWIAQSPSRGDRYDVGAWEYVVHQLALNGWRLALAFDMNPNPTGAGLALDIDEGDDALDLDLRSVAAYFHILDVDEIFDRIKAVVGDWREIAGSLGISRAEQDALAPAFRS